MKTSKLLALLILSTVFFGINSYGNESMEEKTKEAFSEQLNQWISKKKPSLKGNIKNKLKNHKEEILRHFGKRQVNDNVLTVFSIFSKAVIQKEIKYEKIINKKEVSINLKEDNLSFKVKFTY